MKNQTYFISAVMLFLICNASSPVFGQFTFGVKAGFGLSSAITGGLDDSYTTIDAKMIPRLQIGGIVNYEKSENLTLQSGLLIIGKGAKFVEDDDFGTFIYKYTPVYLQIPFHLVYNGNKFYIGGGPYFGYAIAGKIKYDEGDSEEISFGNNDYDSWRSLELGIGIQGGTDIGPVRVGMSYDFGITNTIPKNADYWTNSDSGSSRNSILSLFAVYMFGK
jgi:hypothetical protein